MSAYFPVGTISSLYIPSVFHLDFPKSFLSIPSIISPWVSRAPCALPPFAFYLEQPEVLPVCFFIPCRFHEFPVYSPLYFILSTPMFISSLTLTRTEKNLSNFVLVLIPPLLLYFVIVINTKASTVEAPGLVK